MLPEWMPTGAEVEWRAMDHELQHELSGLTTRPRVAIVGFSSTSRHLVQWNDPHQEIWTLNQSYVYAGRRPDRHFELHLADSRPDPSVPDYLDDLKCLGVPIYMIDHEAEYPTSVKYPLADINSKAPAHLRGYFTCAVAYMAALAVHLGYMWIGCYGVDCTVGTEYEAQKPCLEAWL